MKRLMSWIAFAAWSVSALAADVAPDQLVKQTAESVIAIVKQDKDIQSGDKHKLLALVDEKVLPHFDFTRMTRLAMGRNWNKASPEQQQELTKQFRDLLVRTYAVSLSQYRDQTLEYKPTQMQPDGEAVVRTSVIQSGAQPIPIDYNMYKVNDAWMVYDINVGGVSLVTNYRSTFNDQVRSVGVDGLIKSLAAKNTSSGK